MASNPDLPEGFEAWPAEIQSRYLSEFHALYFPHLRWWEKPESDEDDSGPRPKQLPPDHPRHGEPDSRGYRCGCKHKIPNCTECPPCPGNSQWSTWLMLTARGTGKALDVDTLIPVPSGWRKLADIAVGDEVFDESGRTCRVTATFDVMPDEAYRLTFADGTFLDACADHQWVTWTHRERAMLLRSPRESTRRFPAEWPEWRVERAPRESGSKRGRPRVYPDSQGPQVRTTAEIVKTIACNGMQQARNHCIPLCGPLDLPELDLPVDPYVLGVWLGDGASAGGTVTISDADAGEMLGLLAAAGTLVSGVSYRKEGAACANYPVGGQPGFRDPVTGRMGANGSLCSILRSLDLLNSKHVPAVYLRGSPGQRLALLQGLMDTDGGWSRGTVEFSSTKQGLALAVTELARSLGQKPICAEGRATLYGKDCGPKWRVTWTPTINVFRLRRKADVFKADGAQSLRNHHRMIKSAELIDPKPMRCLTVDSRHSMYLAGEGMTPTHNTKAGANWTLEMALSKPGVYVGVCAPTFEAVRGVCIEGESGIIAEAHRNNIEIVSYNKNRQELELAGGSKIVGASAEKPDSIRGYNFAYVWFDELAMIRYFSFYHEALQPAMRKGENPRLLITTTPKRVRLIRDLIEKSRWEFSDADGGEGTGVHLTEAISAENIHFSRRQRLKLEKDYAGNPVMLAQELRGEMLAEVDGALFPIDQFNETRVFPGKDALPQWRRVVVAIDPATTNRETSDETGIVVMSEGDDGDFYCLEDCSGKFAPDQQMRIAAEAFYRNGADCVVGEVNITGDYMRALLSTVDPNIPLRNVHGMKGKVSRAQGPSSLFAQGRIHHVGDNFRLLEDQLSAMAEGDDRNRMKDDRADAWVWAVLHLSGTGQGNWAQVYGFRDCHSCGARVNEDKDTACHNCGAKVEKQAPKHAGGRPAQIPWSEAYLRTCPNCDAKYTPRERSCPKCKPTPENYLQQVLALQGGGGKLGYSGGNWLAGRKF